MQEKASDQSSETEEKALRERFASINKMLGDLELKLELTEEDRCVERTERNH